MMNSKTMAALAYAASCALALGNAACEKRRSDRAKSEHFYDSVPSSMTYPLCVGVSITSKRIRIIPEFYDEQGYIDKEHKRTARKLRTQEYIEFPPEGYRWAWAEVENSKRYQEDECYARRMREAFVFALKEFKKYYGTILS